jgi:pyruvate/oxaloacetate carboxyltransferase
MTPAQCEKLSEHIIDFVSEISSYENGKGRKDADKAKERLEKSLSKVKSRMEKLKAEAAKWSIQEEDVLTYAMFPQVAPKFFEKRNARLQGVDALHADYENKSHPV